MRGWEEFTFIFLLAVSGTNAQFGEIASLATSLLGGALGNGAGIGALAGAGAAGAGAAGQAGGALAQIGQLYQLAQGALQLTGTGVGVLNQASEGNWFPAVLEQTAKNSQALMKQGGGNGLNLGALGPAPGKTGGAGLGPEFGTSFPAPNIDDYDENAEIPGVTEKKTPKAPDGLVDIEDEDYEIDTTTAGTTTTTHAPTTTTTEFFAEEDEEETTTEPTSPPPRQIRIQLPDKDGKSEPEEELDYEDLINKKSEKGPQVIPTIDAESTDELKRNIIATHGTKTQPIVPKLEKLVEVLQKSKLSKEEIDEIVAQVEGNRHIEKPAKYDFNAAVQNIPDKKNTIRQKITDASRIINSNFENQHKEQNFVIQKQVDELKVLPDFTDSSIAPVQATLPTTTTTTIAPKPTTTKAPTTTTKPIPASPSSTITPVPATTTTVSPKHVQQSRSVPAGPTQPIPVPQQAVAPQVAQSVAPQVAPQVLPQPQQPFNNFLYPHNQFQQPFQQQLYYTQAPFYGQQTQNYWGQQQNQFNHQYGLPQQQPFQQYGYSTPYPTQQPQQVQPHQPVQQVQQPHQQVQQVQQPHQQIQQPHQQIQQPQHVQQSQHIQQPQQQYYTQQYVPPQQIQHPQQPQQPQPPQQPQQYHQQSQYQTQQLPPRPQQPQAPIQQRPPPSQQVVYRQGSAQPTAAPQRPPLQNANQVVHYYNDGKQIVQQIIPKRIAANGNLPLSGPFQSQAAASTDPAEYQRRQRALQQAYHQPQTRAVETQGHARIAQPPARVQPRIYESTVTATGHRQAHAIRTYQATKSASVTPPNPQPAAATRSSGRVSSSKKRYSGHVLPGPTIDHRSLLEKRTTAKPRYVRVP